MDTLIDQKHIDRFTEIVQNSHNIIIVPHINPDGDAIGSCLALKSILFNLRKNCEVIIPNEFPDFLQWIDGSSDVIDFEKSEQQAKQKFAEADTLFVLDFNDFDRSEGLKDLLPNFEGTKVMIDHHPNPKAECDLVISYPAVCSTCELLFRLAERAGYLPMINKSAAEAFFTGIMTDTGNFSYNANDPETYHIVAKLLEKGIDKDIVHSNVYHTFSEDRWRLIGYALEKKMIILPEFQTGYISLNKAELEQFNYQSGDTEGLVNYPLSVKGVVFCALFIERDDIVKLSFRSKGTFSTNSFARSHFSGGGHVNASGGSTILSLDEAVAKFVSLLPEYKSQLLTSY